MVCVISLCIDVMLMNVCFLSYICYYMLCMWFHGGIEIWEEEWMSFNCFSNWAREFLQGVQLNCQQGVRWQKGSIRDRFCSHFLKGAVRHSAVQGVRRPRESLRVANLSNELKDCCCRSAQSWETSTLVEVEGFPQGVCARSSLFLRDSVTVESSGRIGLWVAEEQRRQVRLEVVRAS